jgi:thiol:disulfide interchange protein
MAQTNQRSVPIVLVIIAVALVAARIGAQWFTPEAPASGLVHWLPIQEVGPVAAQTNKIILIDFTAEWCTPCHHLDAEVFGDPALAAEINKRFLAVRVTDRKREEGRNSPLVAQLEQRYGVNSFPTLVFIDADGTERGRMEGYGGREEFRRVMESIR